MFKGKFYAQCDTYGRFGADGRQASQDYILDHGDIWGAKKQGGEGATEPEIRQEKPAPTPAAAQPKQPAQPAPKPAPKPEPQPQPKREKWGLSW